MLRREWALFKPNIFICTLFIPLFLTGVSVCYNNVFSCFRNEFDWIWEKFNAPACQVWLPVVRSGTFSRRGSWKGCLLQSSNLFTRSILLSESSQSLLLCWQWLPTPPLKSATFPPLSHQILLSPGSYNDGIGGNKQLAKEMLRSQNVPRTLG